MSEPTGSYRAPGQGPLPGQPGYGEPVPDPWAPVPQQGTYGQPQAYGQYGGTQQYGATGQYGGSQPDGTSPQYQPYGQTPYAQSQYGQSQYGQTQYGQTQYGQTQYGQTQYGAPQYGPPPQHGYGPPAARPGGGTVITAAVIQIVQASLFVLVALALLFVADMVNTAGDEFDQQAGSDISDTTDAASRWVAVGGLVLLAAAVFMIVLAALAIRGRRWAAITSVVLQALSALGSLVGLTQSGSGDSPGFAVVFLLASIAVVVLFLLPASTAYFAAKTADRAALPR